MQHFKDVCPTSFCGGTLSYVYQHICTNFPSVFANSQYQSLHSPVVYRTSGEILVMILKSSFIRSIAELKGPYICKSSHSTNFLSSSLGSIFIWRTLSCILNSMHNLFHLKSFWRIIWKALGKDIFLIPHTLLRFSQKVMRESH